MHCSDHAFGHRAPYRPHRDFTPPQRRGRASTFAALATIVLLATWAGATSLYLLFRDDALKLLAERQAALSRAYDAQVAQLKAEIDRLQSLKLIEQERVDRALVDLARRQTIVESRQATINALAGQRHRPSHEGAPETTGSLPAIPSAPPKPSPLSDTLLIAPPGERWARLESRPLPSGGAQLAERAAGTPFGTRIDSLARTLAQIETTQGAALNRLEEHYDGLETRMRGVFADLGIQPPRGVGGPFLPWTRPPEDPFARQVHRVRTATLAIEELRRGLRAVPVRRPSAGDADVSSGFGMRVDPFIRQLAMHTGIDFRGDTGDPVRAAAAGTVALAERNGGYGLMVEVDHGNGIATRYAHLSAIEVANGASVTPGSVLGRIGSTGRSTGPHLHYEVRINGEPVDPQRYLRAGLRLGEPL